MCSIYISLLTSLTTIIRIILWKLLIYEKIDEIGCILAVQVRGLICKGIRRKYQYTIQCTISSMIEDCACICMFVYARTAKLRKASETKKSVHRRIHRQNKSAAYTNKSTAM